MRGVLMSYGKGLLVALVSGAVLAGAEPPQTAVTRGSPLPPAGVAGPIVARGFRSEQTFPEVAEPVRVRIPALGVNSRLQRLGRERDGTIAVPGRVDVAGWYHLGARPGQPGPAVILGHVDSTTGPGVFAGLAGVRPGSPVLVERADGSEVTFRITGVSRVPKARFPTGLVYAPTLEPTLRLVTCGGGFDRARGSYRDNVIAFADLA
ncbi:class F sortase [Actinoplanes palleronii]|uniref:Class F sortase n=1 Tax=Actinoplanes palleronii TaxID=113570 RepID=A0ABQ4BD32_9ACTN|nr:class F sortase [Actinoplanes palleronii]GIE68564.1 class F sortase [Actinoplanes palleronii]